jgi:myo-inositol catabolism protein IolH
MFKLRLAYDPSHYRDNTNLKDTIEAVARLGYEYVEFSPRKDFIWFYERFKKILFRCRR